MGMYGTIIVFSTAGKPPTDPDATARHAIDAFERHGLLRSGTADVCEKPKPWLGRFAETRNRGELPVDEYALYLVQPDRILPAMSDLVYLVDSEDNVEPPTFELPYLEFSVIKRALPITRSYDGRLLANTWATLEFSYEDVRYDPELHRIRNPNHPIMQALAEVFSSPISWDVDIG